MTRTRLLELAAWLTVAFQLPAFPAGSLERPASAREVMSLDGQWDILFDPTNQGRDAGWNRDDIFETQPTRRTITVPSCWELVEKDYEGVAFYRRKFRVPANWAGRVVRLHFDAVNFRAEVWLNGAAVGCHDGGFTPFEFRVDDLLRPGQLNTLIVRVVGPILLQNKRVDGIGPLPVRRLSDKRFENLAEFIRRGGTAVYLQAGDSQARWGRGGEASPLLPVRAWLKRAEGYWTCIPHSVKEHPIFEGLPTGDTMGPIYENVCANSALLRVKGETIVCSIGFDWFPDYDRSKRHYYGPGDAWWGADLAVVPVGRGRCILSRLRPAENLGRDPVADKILLNLIAWTNRLTQQ